MKYLERITQDEESARKSEAEQKNRLAMNSAERDIIEIEGEIEEISAQINDTKSSDDFDLREVMELVQEKRVLQKDLEAAREIFDELF